jgi:hypothetical protein
MIEIKMTDVFRLTDPVVLSDPNNYAIQLAEPPYWIPSSSNQVSRDDVTTSMYRGGPTMMFVRPNESFLMTDQQFATLVSSVKQGGGPTDFLNNILGLVNRNIIEVIQRDGSNNPTVLSQSDIYNFTA